MGQRSHTTLLLLLAVAAANLHQANTNQSSTSQDAAVSSFSCVGKVIGGYYADISLGCKRFHVCTLGEKGEIRDIAFKCVPKTLFSQEKRVCEREDEVNCSMSKQFYHLNNELYGPGIIPETAAESAASPGPIPQEVHDPTLALMSAPDPPASSADSPSPEDSASISLAAPVLPPAVPPTSSPSPPPTAPPGVTASTSRMSTSTSASINFSYPATLPFTVSKTFSSTSVSASSRVRIKTALSDVSFDRGPQSGPPLPAPHLRPSLLRLAAQNQAILRDHTPPDTVTSQTPVDFQDIPRLTTESAFHTRNKRQTLSDLSDTRRQRVRSDLNLNSSRRRNFVSSRGIRRQQPEPQTTQGQVNSQTQSNDSPNRQIALRSQRKRPPLKSILINDSSQNSRDAKPQETKVEAITKPNRRQRIRRPQSQTQNRRIISNNNKNIHSLNLETNINSNFQNVATNNNDFNAQPFNLDQEKNIMDETQNRLTINNNQNVQEPSSLTDFETSTSNSVSSDGQIENKSQPVQSNLEISRSNSRLRPIARPIIRVGLDRKPSVIKDNINESENNRQQSVFSTQQSPFNTQQASFNRQQSVFNPKQSEPIRQQSSHTDPSHDNNVTPVVSRPLTLTNQFPPDRTVVDTGSEQSPSTVDKNTAPIVSRKQSSIQFAPTSFTCADKIHGGLYADVETGCSVFHICSVEPDGSFRSSRFVCGSGTLFDQTSRTCQAESAVNCARSQSLYYLNEPFQTPVLLEFEAEFPEQQFDFPRVPTSSSPSSNSFTHSRVRREDDEVDLCHTRPVGTPLADITTSCKEYTVCEVSNGQVVEQRYPCKSGQAFSQLHRKCLSAKKVKCAKETLSEILGLGAMRDTARQVLNRRKRGPKSLLHSYRFRRAAVPPLSNLVLTPGVQDARVRRALYNLAALQQWAQDNSHHTAFVEVYTLHTRGKKNYYPKKINVERTYVPQTVNNNYNTYSYVRRSKRQTREDAPLIGKSDIVSQSVTSTGISPAKVQSGISPSKVQSKPLKTITVGSSSSSSAVGNVPVTAKTVATNTTTSTTIPTTTPAKLEEPTPPSIIDPATKITSSTLPATKISSPKVTTKLLTVTVSTVQSTSKAQPSTLLLNNASSSTIAPDPVKPIPSITVTNNIVNPLNTSVETSSTTSETTATTPLPPTTPIVPELPEISNKNESLSLHEASLNSTNANSPAVKNETVIESPTGPANDKAGNGENNTDSTIGDTNTTTTTVATTKPIATITQSPTPDSPVADTITTSEITSTNVTTENPTTVSQSALVVPGGSTLISSSPSPSTTALTTSAPSVTTPEKNTTTPQPQFTTKTTTTTTTTTTPEPPQPTEVPMNDTSTNQPLSRDNLPETSFTCKDKTLEKFYPDTEVNCQVFHYCSPGFTQEQVLDIKFLCTNDTKFDVNTQKCESGENVVCNITTTTPPPPITTTTLTPPSPPSSTSPPPPTTTTTTTPPPPTTTTSTTTTSTTTTSTTTSTPSTTISSTPTPTTTTPKPTTISSTPTTTTTTTPTTTTTTTTLPPPTTPAIPDPSPITTTNTTIQETTTPQVTTSENNKTSSPSTTSTKVTPAKPASNNPPTTVSSTITTPSEAPTTTAATATTTTTTLLPNKTNTEPSTTTDPADEEPVTELGPLIRETTNQPTESPVTKDSTNIETDALATVSTTESIPTNSDSETDNSSSVSHSPTQPTQSAR